MAIGLGTVGLPGPAFWALTPRELDAVLSGRFGAGRLSGAPLSVPELQALMQRFPDQGDA